MMEKLWCCSLLYLIFFNTLAKKSFIMFNKDYVLQYHKNYSLNFGARIRLSDKGLLNLPQKTDLLYSASPLDFFYKESKSKRRLDAVSIKIKDRIRSEQQKRVIQSLSEFF